MYEAKTIKAKGKRMRVKFIGCSDAQANFGRGADPRKYLKVGKIYNRVKKEIHSWHTLYYLESFDAPFNSVCFKEVGAEQ